MIEKLHKHNDVAVNFLNHVLIGMNARFIVLVIISYATRSEVGHI